VTASVVEIGAMTPLQDIADADGIHPVLRDLARREAPRSIRNAATVGGTVALADPESELVAGLLAFGASVRFADADGRIDHRLSDVVADPELLNRNTIIVGVTVAPDGDATAQRTARTPMDRPIVAVVARRGLDGTVTVAATGVADRPAIIDPERLEALDPPTDFRGTSGYRRHIAGILVHRALHEIGSGR
jgi:CO/xanthine dehydrogenase FAD-binding subunit